MSFYSTWMISLLVLLATKNPSIESAYTYAGCFNQVFFDTLYTSSIMEPSLCFRLCGTPMVYLQKTTCRCSGGGLTHHDRQLDTSCSTPCAKSPDRTLYTCGGMTTYSVYAEKQFYTEHGHLFNYQILFASCELWKDDRVYTTIQANFTMKNSSLNKMERCAAACFDQDKTTRSIAFNGTADQCLCIMPWTTLTTIMRRTAVTALPNSSCDLYCHSLSNNSKQDIKFRCGASEDPQVWAIYDLNGTCPSGYTYIKEWKKCFNSYKYHWNSCTSPAKSFSYNKTISWSVFLNVINQLNLTNASVAIDFDDDDRIQSSWKCPVNVTSTSTSSYYSYSFYSSSSIRYVLENGCLRAASYSDLGYRYGYRLCVLDSFDKFSKDEDDDDGLNLGYGNFLETLTKLCPENWYDLNGRCYRMSDQPKTIEDAKNSCILVSKPTPVITSTKSTQVFHYFDDTDLYDDRDEEQLNPSPKGELVIFSSEWQARLGFFLLDFKTDTIKTEATPGIIDMYNGDRTLSIAGNRSTQSSINELQMAYPSETNESSTTNYSCIVSSRASAEQGEEPTLSTTLQNCTKAKHVLCGTQPLITRDFQQGCFQRPAVLGIPALISSRLTYELCLSVCQELQQKLAVLHMNKCYCWKDASTKSINLTVDFEKYRRQSCGDHCPGSQHEKCGNNDTIVVFHIFDSRRIYSVIRTPAEPHPDFVNAGCLHVESLNPSTTYQFNFHHINHTHPRHCLEFCSKSQQKYALMKGDQCFCTNIALTKDEYNITQLPRQHCSQACSANYFYTCGNADNASIYSLYMMQAKCIHGFEVAENDQQCVYSHFSAKKTSFTEAQSYCRSLGGTVAKINDILEIQDILPESVLNTRLHLLILQHFHNYALVDAKSFWIDRTTTIAAESTFSVRLLSKCPETSDDRDSKCILIDRAQNTSHTNLKYNRCISESNQCETMSAIPVCVDRHIEYNSTNTSLPFEKDSTVNITVDYTCGDDPEYHFVDDYCYKIFDHEVKWSKAQTQCEDDHATLFVPEKSITLQIIKSLFVRRNVYGSSAFAHVGVIYDNKTQRVLQYDTTGERTRSAVPSSNSIYDLCATTFQEAYAAMISRTRSSALERSTLKDQPMGCAYIDLLSYKALMISCDEIPCARVATVICQKRPLRKISIVKATRKSMDISTTTTTTKTKTTTTGTRTSAGASVVDSTTTVDDDSTADENINSVGRDYAPIFFVLAVGVALVLLGMISTLYNRYLFRKSNSASRTGRSTRNSIYSPLSSENDFDLH